MGIFSGIVNLFRCFSFFKLSGYLYMCYNNFAVFFGGMEENMGYRVKIDIFEGPFDLLVYLIEHAQMSIYDIKISEITDQYMAYVGDMNKADVNISSEFMTLAAALIEIKSKMLLPRSVPQEGSGNVSEDPRTELVAKLVEYKRFKTISELLEDRWEDTDMYLEKPQEDLTEYTGESDEYLNLDIDQFRTAFEKFLNRKRKLEEIKKHHKRSAKQRITTETRMENIKDFFRKSHLKEVDFRQLVHEKNDRYDIAVTFSSVLEMMKQRRLDASQPYIYGDITVNPTAELFCENQMQESDLQVKEEHHGR